MTRATQTISIALLALSVYLLLALPLITENSPIPAILPTKIQVEIVPVLPFLALIGLACYLMGRLGWGILQFNDVVPAHTELMAQIDEAKKNLDKRGVGWN